MPIPPEAPSREGSRPPVSLTQIGRVFGRLGLIGFGGPLAHIALIQEEVQERRGWLAYLRVNPLVDPLRGQPRFEALLEKLRL